jgi:hypothetical protein
MALSEKARGLNRAVINGATAVCVCAALIFTVSDIDESFCIFHQQ